MLGTDGTDTTSASKATTLQDATLTTVNFETTVDTSPHTATSHDNCVSYPSSGKHVLKKLKATNNFLLFWRSWLRYLFQNKTSQISKGKFPVNV